MRVDVVERLPEHGAVKGEAAEDTSVKLALQNFQSAMQGDDSLFASEYRGNWRVSRAGDGRGICSGNVSLSFKEKETFPLQIPRPSPARLTRQFPLYSLAKRESSPCIAL